MGMENPIHVSKFSIWVLAIGLLTQNLVMATREFENQKTYYSPDPHHGTPSTGSHGSSPSHHHGGGTTPSHGGGSPSHGGGGYGGGTPPSHSTPTDPSPGNCGTPPSHVPTPSNPPSGGGGYYPSPSPPTSGGSPPSTPTTPYVPTPSTPSPSTPYVPTPSTPYVPTPSTPTTPSPPFVPVDPNSPFSCNYWRNHPGIVWGLVGWWGTVGNAFGVTSLPGIGSTSSTTGTSLQQLLSNTRSDGYGTLYREGTASLLNSMVTHKFPFTTMQVRDRFISALSSNKAAAAQGHLFKMANDGKLKA
ncbi:protodermal factor 1 [Euphorbia peplus]|nr:protodermal factor 1 [Euphorbia peplus]